MNTQKDTEGKNIPVLLWQGLKAILSGIANWITVILGMRDDSTYGKILRRTVGSCYAIVMLLFTTLLVLNFFDFAIHTWVYDHDHDEMRYEPRRIGDSVIYFHYNDMFGFVMTSKGDTTLTGVSKIAEPLGEDSLVCYSNGYSCGYFSRNTGWPVIEERYSHAWLFSEGLAAVDEEGWIKFIDASGKVVIDPKVPYILGSDGYVFHNNHCAIHNACIDSVGLMDRQGEWALKPEYHSIKFHEGFWIIDNADSQCVLDSTLKTVIPFVKGKIKINDKDFTAVNSNHVVQRYSRSGELIDDFCVSDVS